MESKPFTAEYAVLACLLPSTLEPVMTYKLYIILYLILHVNNTTIKLVILHTMKILKWQNNIY